MPQISIVMPFRGNQAELPTTLKSILEQSLQDWELIAVGEPGDEESATIIRQLNDPRIKVLTLPHWIQPGISAKRNYGNLEASSDLICVADADDLYLPDRFEKTLNFFKENPEVDFFYSYFEVYEVESDHLRTPGLPYTSFKNDSADHGLIKGDVFIAHPTVAYWRRNILNIPYNPFFRLAEDYDVATRFAVLGKKFGSLPDVLVRKRVHSQGIGASNRDLQKAYAHAVRFSRGWEPKNVELWSLIQEGGAR